MRTLRAACSPPPFTERGVEGEVQKVRAKIRLLSPQLRQSRVPLSDLQERGGTSK